MTELDRLLKEMVLQEVADREDRRPEVIKEFLADVAANRAARRPRRMIVPVLYERKAGK